MSDQAPAMSRELWEDRLRFFAKQAAGKKDCRDAILADIMSLQAEVERRGEEIEVLRIYGNKDCTWMADQELERRRAIEKARQPK